MTILERPGYDHERMLRYARWRFYSYEKAPLFKADWTDLVFHHFKLDARALADEVPFELDLFEGEAYVSLVGFRTTRMYVHRLGEWTRWIHFPISHHSFLNVRTYVKHRGEPGIYFIKEYVNSLPAVPVGRLAYGLPYSYAMVSFDHKDPAEGLMGEIEREGRGSLRYYCEAKAGAKGDVCDPGGLEEFLSERYSAFTCHAGRKRVFRILHEPWHLVALDTNWDETRLLENDFAWFERAKPAGSYWTRGVFDVAISRPRWIGRGPKVGPSDRIS